MMYSPLPTNEIEEAEQLSQDGIAVEGHIQHFRESDPIRARSGRSMRS